MTVKTVSLLYFASLAEQLGTDKESLETQAQTIKALKAELSRRGDVWQEIAKKNILCAINQTIANDAHPLSEGDEVAFFPPVTGG